MHLIGIDGGGTRSTVAVADVAGRELVRLEGPPGLVEPRDPGAAVEVLIALARRATAEANVVVPAAALCAGLAGVGNPAEREAVRGALAADGLARRVVVVSDSEIALEGAFAGGPGVLLIAGTGSVAYGRGEDGRAERCGGWGLFVGDEGSGYAIGRDALVAALRCADGRGPPTPLLPALLRQLELPGPLAVPSWIGRASKARVAALVPEVARLAAAGDAVAEAIFATAAAELAQHGAALIERLRPWNSAPRIVYFGGVFRTPGFADRVSRALTRLVPSFRVREPAGDAVGGAVRVAARLAAAG